MSIRRAKQLIYGALYVLILIFFAGIFYIIFIRPITSGPAVAICTPSTCAPTSTAVFGTSTVLMFMTSPGHYTFLTNVVNSDANFGAQMLNYQIDFYDANNALIGSIPAQSFIYPSQSKYLLVPNVAISQTVDHAAIEIASASWTPSSTLGDIPQFVLQNTQASVLSSTTVAVSGQLTNANIGSYEKVVVLVVFNNGNPNNPIGASQTEIDNVSAQLTTNFSVMYPAPPNIAPVNNQIIVYALR